MILNVGYKEDKILQCVKIKMSTNLTTYVYMQIVAEETYLKLIFSFNNFSTSNVLIHKSFPKMPVIDKRHIYVG